MGVEFEFLKSVSFWTKLAIGMSSKTYERRFATLRIGIIFGVRSALSQDSVKNNLKNR